MNLLRDFMRAEGISQADLARGIGRSEAFVSQMCAGKSKPSQETIDNTLAFLCRRLRRRVTYERIHAQPKECQ